MFDKGIGSESIFDFRMYSKISTLYRISKVKCFKHFRYWNFSKKLLRQKTVPTIFVDWLLGERVSFRRRTFQLQKFWSSNDLSSLDSKVYYRRPWTHSVPSVQRRMRGGCVVSAEGTTKLPSLCNKTERGWTIHRWRVTLAYLYQVSPKIQRDSYTTREPNKRRKNWGCRSNQQPQRCDQE